LKALIIAGILTAVSAAATKHGTVIFPAGFKMLPSQDGQFHACMRHYAEWGDDRLRGVCLYAPAGM